MKILGNESGMSNWWIAVWTIAAALAGAIVKTFSDLVGRRNSFDEKFRTDLMAWNERQQREIDSLNAKVVSVEQHAGAEQQLRHELRNQLNAEKLAHELAKSECDALKLQFADLKAERDLLILKLAECAKQIGEKTSEVVK